MQIYIYIYIYTDMCVYMYIYIYIYIYIHMYIWAIGVHDEEHRLDRLDLAEELLFRDLSYQ